MYHVWYNGERAFQVRNQILQSQFFFRKRARVLANKPVHFVSLNPFTTKFNRKQISTKFPHFTLWNFEKQIALCESTESFHLSGHIIGFHPQTQKLESP